MDVLWATRQFLKNGYIHLFCMCEARVCHNVLLEVKGHLGEVGSLFPLCGSRGSNSGH